MGNKLLPTDFKVEIDSTSRFYLRDGIYALENIDSSSEDFMPDDRMFFELNGEADLEDTLTVDSTSGVITTWGDPLAGDGRKLDIDSNHKFQPDTITIHVTLSWEDSLYHSQAFILILFKSIPPDQGGDFYQEVFVFEESLFPSGDYIVILDSSDFPDDVHSYQFILKYIYNW
jgi:hypothetical protein